MSYLEEPKRAGDRPGPPRARVARKTGLEVRALPPWFENLKKRQVKSPKVYLRDSGVLHSLLDLETRDELQGHPKAGGSWEGFVVEQILDLVGTRDAYFWETHQGAELDLLLFHRGRRWGFEVKLTDAPRVTRSMRIAQSDLSLDLLWVVHAGAEGWTLDRRIQAVACGDLVERLAAEPNDGGKRG